MTTSALMGNRIKLTPAPRRQLNGSLEVAMLGHCPGEADASQLSAAAREEIRSLGFGPRMMRRLDSNVHLHHLPIPLYSLAEFEALFPESRGTAGLFSSQLAGSNTWLLPSVEDFFANGGDKLWILQIPEEQGVAGFLPHFDSPLYDVDNLQGLACALILNQVGVIAFPDLERIQVPANLQDVPRKRLANPNPQFVPCGTDLDDDHRERRHSSEMLPNTEPVAFISLLQKVLGFVNKHRSDVQCLFSLPLSYSDALGSPQVDTSAIDAVNQVTRTASAYRFRQVQFVFPYLRNERYPLRSNVGALSGLISASARNNGVWRSIADQALQVQARPYPPVSRQQKIQLRESPGVGVVTQQRGRVVLDDERTCVPAMHRSEYIPGTTSEQLQGLHSGEVVRFLGYLKRQLQMLGERLIFNLDYRDPRPKLMLEQFFSELFQRGALRGSAPEQAFEISRSSVQQGVLAFDIKVAPAFPIDQIRLTFVNRQGAWQTEVQHA